MNNEQQLLILYWQISAALLMGIDYLLPSKAKEYVDTKVRNYLEGVQGRVDQDISSGLNLIKENRWKIGIAFLFLAIFYLAIESIKLVGASNFPTLAAIVSLVALFFFTGGFLVLLNIFMQLVTPLGLGSVVRTLLTFLNKSPKGPIAAGGMLCLFVSFALRYHYYA
jgi:hypothetical protein